MALNNNIGWEILVYIDYNLDRVGLRHNRHYDPNIDSYTHMAWINENNCQRLYEWFLLMTSRTQRSMT